MLKSLKYFTCQALDRLFIIQSLISVSIANLCILPSRYWLRWGLKVGGTIQQRAERLLLTKVIVLYPLFSERQSKNIYYLSIYVLLCILMCIGFKITAFWAAFAVGNM